MKIIFVKEIGLGLARDISSLFFFKNNFEVKYKCVYLHSLSERALRQEEKVSSMKR
jgi:hypothetical protein